jgi:Helix-turn-helix domain
MTSPTLHTTAQAAALLGLDASSVRRLARKLKLGQRLGRDWFFTQADLDRMRKRPSVGNPSFVQRQ